MSDERRRVSDRPRVVVVGGGHGQAASLRAIKHYSSAITAIVSVADDGGSSGRLRELLGIPAPGDIRTCLGALLPEGSPIARTLEHRFALGELEGHPLGNLLIAALAATMGDFAAGVAEACRVLGAAGRVIPATSGPVVLEAESSAGDLHGQVEIMKGGNIGRISLVPRDAASPAEALRAVEAADQIVIGPGSLYTSVLAACVAPGVRDAIEAAGGKGVQRVYVSNLREQPPETSGYDVAAHISALVAHGVRPDVVLADTRAIALGEISRAGGAPQVIELDLTGPTGLAHDSGKLGAALASLLGWREAPPASLEEPGRA
jgi:uncharacterized cofD-like protein